MSDIMEVDIMKFRVYLYIYLSICVDVRMDARVYYPNLCIYKNDRLLQIKIYWCRDCRRSLMQVTLGH